VPGIRPVEQRGADVADVQITRGRRAEPDSHGHCTLPLFAQALIVTLPLFAQALIVTLPLFAQALIVTCRSSRKRSS